MFVMAPRPFVQEALAQTTARDSGPKLARELGHARLVVRCPLLRVLDQGEYQAVGEAVARRVDVRFVGATHRDESHFRPSFLARFLTRIRLPSPRETREDIPLLARHFLLRYFGQAPELRERFCRNGPGGRLEPNISARLIDELVRRPLPLNARELHALLIRAIDTSGVATGDDRGGAVETAFADHLARRGVRAEARRNGMLRRRSRTRRFKRHGR